MEERKQRTKIKHKRPKPRIQPFIRITKIYQKIESSFFDIKITQ